MAAPIEPAIKVAIQTRLGIVGVPAVLAISTIGATFDGQGSAIVAGSKAFVRVPYACTITEATALGDVVGSVVVDVWRDSFANHPLVNADSITGSTPVTITTANRSTDTALTGWTVAINAGDVVCFHVDSCSAIKQLQIQLKVIR